MKKILLAIITITTVISVKAQIPNPGFENWTNAGSYDDPDNWGTLNSTTSALGVYTVTKGTPGYGGSNSYIKLTARSLGAFGTVPGLVVTGSINTTTQAVYGGFPCSTRPVSMGGFFQHMATGTGGAIVCVFTSWNSTTMSTDTIGAGALTLTGMAMSWSGFTVPITFFASGNPDTCQIIMMTSVTNVTANDYLWVDDLAFNFNTGIEDHDVKSLNASVFPNPCSEFFTLNYACDNNETFQVDVTDITGKIFQQETMNAMAGENKFDFDVADLSSGLYFVTIRNNELIETKPILVK